MQGQSYLGYLLVFLLVELAVFPFALEIVEGFLKQGDHQDEDQRSDVSEQKADL